jgi:serine/threonine protein kinase
MTPERWQQIEKLYHSVLEVEESQRIVFLEEACAGDEELRREVESLLRSEPTAERFIEETVLEIAAQGMAETRSQSRVERQIGSYKILSLLGMGGMGEVYLAQDPRLNRTIALKVLRAELASDQDRMRRFIREARAASSLKHPNVATIHEIGESEGIHFIAMEYIEGQSLAAKISSRPVEPTEIVEIGLQVGGHGVLCLSSYLALHRRAR